MSLLDPSRKLSTINKDLYKHNKKLLEENKILLEEIRMLKKLLYGLDLEKK